MDTSEALKLWNKLGNITDSHTDEYDNYVINFINKSGEIVGNITVYPGQGISKDLKSFEQ